MIILWIVTCEISTWQIFNWLSFPGNGSFGFENGANTNPFSVEPTSYDYDSPISEAGDLTDKFFKFKDVIAKYLPIPAIEVRCFIHTFENARANTSLKTHVQIHTFENPRPTYTFENGCENKYLWKRMWKQIPLKTYFKTYTFKKHVQIYLQKRMQIAPCLSGERDDGEGELWSSRNEVRVDLLRVERNVAETDSTKFGKLYNCKLKKVWSELKWKLNRFLNSGPIGSAMDLFTCHITSVTRLGDLLDLGQLFKAFGNN